MTKAKGILVCLSEEFGACYGVKEELTITLKVVTKTIFRFCRPLSVSNCY